MKTKIENKVASRSVYDMITDRITEQLAKGIVPWHQPWAGGSALAISYRSRKPYSMLNQLLLGKPGEEQMCALKYASTYVPDDEGTLAELYEQLKKL